jgi:hypothetical protein
VRHLPGERGIARRYHGRVGRFVASVLTGAAIATGAIAFTGCGSSSSQTDNAVVRAADVTARVPGYRMSATMQVSTATGTQKMQMAGVVDRANRTGQFTEHATTLGRQLNLTFVFSALIFYMKAAGIPQISKVTGGKPWVKFDMSRMLGAMGLGALPTSTDPSQFVDYLRAVSSSTKSLGTATIGDVSTTHYHATIDLSRYTKLVPASQRAAAQRGISTLESALGSHTLPIDAWIDHKNLVRRINLNFAECAAGQHIKMSMLMDLYDYGPQQPTQMPAASDAFDLTPLLTSALSQIKLGC